MALDIFNEVTVTRADKFLVTCEGEGKDALPRDETNLVVEGVKRAFAVAGKDMPPLHYHLKQEIPHARGLGSSSAGIVSGLLAGLCLAGHRLEVQHKEALLQLASEMEGHPDNVCPAIYGGIQLSIFSEHDKRYKSERLPVPHDLVCVCFIPKSSVVAGKKTEELRKVVPKEVSMTDAVAQVGHFAWLVHALLTGKTENLREGFEDRFHQRQRGAAVYGHLLPMIDAAYKAGAVAAWLSGAGPTVMTWVTGGGGDYFTQLPAERKDAEVAQALRDVAAELDLEGNVYITHVAHTGGCVVAATPPFTNEVLIFNGRT